MRRRQQKRVSRWNTIALSAAKQAKRGIIPEVREVRNFKDILEEVQDTNSCLFHKKAKECRHPKNDQSGKGKKSMGSSSDQKAAERKRIEQLKAAGGQTMSQETYLKN